MLGVACALIAAFSIATADAFTKRAHGVDPLVVALVRFLPSVPALALLITLTIGWSVYPVSFYLLVCGVSAPIEVGIIVLHVMALSRAPLSQVAPLMALTSVVLMPLAYVLLGEAPSLLGSIGVIVGAGGVWFVAAGSSTQAHNRLWGMLQTSGCRIALLNIFVSAFGIIVAKFALGTGQLLHVAFYTYVTECLLLSLLIMVSKRSFRGVTVQLIVGGGLFQTVNNITHYAGLLLLPAAYFIAVKRISVFISVFYGALLFREAHIRERLFGGAMIVCAVVLIVIQ